MTATAVRVAVTMMVVTATAVMMVTVVGSPGAPVIIVASTRTGAMSALTTVVVSSPRPGFDGDGT